MRKTALIVYNPSSASVTSPDLWLGEVIHTICNRGGFQAKVLATTPEMGQIDITPEDFADSDVVIAAGGDGTVRLVLAALAHYRSTVPVGILPLGTGNQLARNLSIYEENLLADSLKQALNVVLKGKPKAIDLGMMNGQYFAVAAGVGPFSDAIIEPGAAEKATWRMLAYASSMVQTFIVPPVIFSVNADGEEFRVRASGVFITNIADLGVGTLSESAEIDDGLLDLCVLDPHEFHDYLELGFRFAGGFAGGKAPYYIRKVQRLSIDIHSGPRRLSNWQKVGQWIRRNVRRADERALPAVIPKVRAMIDGDEYGTTPIEISVAPRAVRVLVPSKPYS
jgi:diacylglycerol kinase family enzyme